jgi:trehalose-6-phosphatase
VFVGDDVTDADGIAAARASGAHVMVVGTPAEVRTDLILRRIEEIGRAAVAA